MVKKELMELGVLSRDGSCCYGGILKGRGVRPRFKGLTSRGFQNGPGVMYKPAGL